MKRKSKMKSVDLLRNEEIDTKDVDKLKEARKFTLKSIQKATHKQLSKIGGFSYQKIQKIKTTADKLCANCGIVSGDQVVNESFVISTGVKSIDELLSCGIKSMQITEVFGKSPEVMTILSHTLCVTSQCITNSDYSEGKAAFIDISGTYNTDYIEVIAEKMGIQNPNRALLNTSHYRIREKEDLLELLDKFPKLFYEANGAFNFIVVDSFSSLFSNKNEKKLKREILIKLQNLSEDYNCAVLITNEKMMKEITSIKPTIVRFEIKHVGITWEARLQNDSLQYENDAQFAVTNSVLCDL